MSILVSLLERNELARKTVRPEYFDRILDSNCDDSAFLEACCCQGLHHRWESPLNAVHETEYVHRPVAHVASITIAKPFPAEAFDHQFFDANTSIEIVHRSGSKPVLNNQLMNSIGCCHFRPLCSLRLYGEPVLKVSDSPLQIPRDALRSRIRRILHRLPNPNRDRSLPREPLLLQA